jgi:hypothetical protein
MNHRVQAYLRQSVYERLCELAKSEEVSLSQCLGLLIERALGTVSPSDYVTRKEFESFQEEIRAQLQKDIGNSPPKYSDSRGVGFGKSSKN